MEFFTKMKKERRISFVFHFIIAVALLLVPAFAMAATSVGNNVSIGGTLSVTGNTTLTANLTVNGTTTTVGNAATDKFVITADVDSNVLPDGNNTYDLGAFASAWNDVFASGTIYASAGTVFNTSGTSTLYLSSGTATRGGRIILEDNDGAGCSEIYILNGTVVSASVTCP